MPATLIRLGYGTPVSGVYPSFFNLSYPAWQLKGGGGYLLRAGRRMAKTPIYRGTLVQGLARLPNEQDIQLIYRPRLRESTTEAWYAVLNSIEEELLKQECGLYWGDHLRGRFLLEQFTWAPRDAGYPPDTNTTYGGFFGREVDVNLKLVRLLDG